MHIFFSIKDLPDAEVLLQGFFFATKFQKRKLNLFERLISTPSQFKYGTFLFLSSFFPLRPSQRLLKFWNIFHKILLRVRPRSSVVAALSASKLTITFCSSFPRTSFFLTKLFWRFVRITVLKSNYRQIPIPK